MTDTTPKYGVHLASNGSAGYAYDYVAADTLREAREALREFADGVGAVGNEGPGGEPPATALITAYDPRDTLEQTWGEYLVGYVMGPRGGVRRVEI